MPCTAGRKEFVPSLYTKFMKMRNMREQSNLIAKLVGPEYEDDLFRFIRHSDPKRLTGVIKSGRKQADSDIRNGVLHGGIDGVPLYIIVRETDGTNKHMVLVRVYKKLGQVRTFNLYRGCAYCQSTTATTKDEAKSETKTKTAFAKLPVVCQGCKITEYCCIDHQVKHAAFHKTQCDGLSKVMA
jgi:hypothetical protein